MPDSIESAQPEATTTEPVSGDGRYGMFAAFRFGDFRYFWIATSLASAGRWTEAVIFGWLVLEMTSSPFLLGVVMACRWVGYGLGPVFGAYVDRHDRRRLLLLITATSVVYSCALAFLVTANLVEYWHIVAIALTAGLVHGFDIPLRYAFTGDLVDRRTLANAIALNTVAVDITAMLGPALAGPLINIIGTGGVCWLLAANYILNVLALYVIRHIGVPHKVVGGSLANDLKTIGRFIGSTPAVMALLGMAVVFNFLQYPLRYALVPVFASDILAVGAAGYGFLLSATGGGALLGAAVVAGLGDTPHKIKICIAGSVAAGIAACAFSLSTSYSLSLVLMACIGVCEAASMTTMTPLLMLQTPKEMRGRIMGVRSLAVLPLSLGSIMSGAIASQFGAPTAGVANGALLVSSILLIVMLVPSVRRIR
jgi:MFS family permease